MAKKSKRKKSKRDYIGKDEVGTPMYRSEGRRVKKLHRELKRR